jgi:hypothetical protein
METNENQQLTISRKKSIKYNKVLVYDKIVLVTISWIIYLCIVLFPQNGEHNFLYKL